MTSGASSRTASNAAERGAARWLGLAGLLALTALVYWPSLDAGLTNWDDDSYVTGNPLFGQPAWQAIQLAFTSYWKGNYHPLAMLSLNLDHAVSGGSVRFHHLMSVVLHLVNTGLVALFVERLLGRRSLALVVALLFGLHPMHVESVAWISARKDLISALFHLLSLLAYLRFARADAAGSGSASAQYARYAPYSLSLLFFLLALLSKGTAVALAPTLIAVDALLGRGALSRPRLVEKIPFFVLALGFGLLALDAQSSVQQLQGVSHWAVHERVALAAYAYLRYVWLLALPYPLSAFYPYPNHVDAALPSVYYLALLGVAGVVLLWWRSLRSWPVLAFALSFYTLHIVFLLQLVPVGGAIIADRYSYLSAIGLFVAGAWVGGEGIARWSRLRGPIVVLLGLYIAVLGVAAFERAGVWRDSLSLWNDTLAVHPDIPEARLNRALARYEQGDLDGAVADLSEAVRLSPQYAQAWGHRGVIRQQLGQNEAALSDLDQAVRLEPNSDLLTNRGAVRLTLGHASGALEDFSRALELNPGMVLAWANRGMARNELGQYAAALQDFEIALQLAPGYASAIYGRAVARRAMGQSEQALIDLDALLTIAADDAIVRLTRGETLLDVGRQTEACSELRVARGLGAAEAAALLTRHCGE